MPSSSGDRLSVVACALTLAVAAGTARADEQLGLADVDREIAREVYQRGRQRYEAGDYAAALAAFEEARRVLPAPELDFNIARCHDHLHNWAEAARAYERFVAARPQDATTAEVRARIAVLRERAGLPPLPPEPRVPPSGPRVTASVTKTAARPGVAAPAAVLGAALGVGVVGAGLLGHVGRTVSNAADGSLPRDEVQGLRREAYAGYALLGVAGALAVVDIVLWVRWARAPRAR